MNGGNRPDLLTGGGGKDKFVLTSSAGGDIIIDFTDGVDSIVLAGDLSFGQLSISSSNGNTLIHLGTTALATLTGVDSSLITTGDFVQLFRFCDCVLL